MKHTLLLLLLLVLTVPGIAQTTDAVSMNPEKPTVTDKITVTYHPASLSAQLKESGDLSLHLLVMGELQSDASFKELPMTKEGNTWGVSFSLADPKATFFAYRFAAADNVDDNDENTWHAMAYGKDGRPVQHANLMLHYFLTWGIRSFAHESDKEGAAAALKAERTLYPDNYRAAVRAWNLALSEDGSEEALKSLKAELAASYEKWKNNEPAVWPIVQTFQKAGDSAKADAITHEMLQRSPRGAFAREQQWAVIWQEPDSLKRLRMMEKHIEEFPPETPWDRQTKMQNLFNQYVRVGDYDGAVALLAKFDRPQPNLYNQVAWKLIEKGEQLEKAVGWAETGVRLSREPDQTSRAYSKTTKEWREGSKRSTGMILDTYAYGLEQLKRDADAERAYAEAFDALKGEDPDVSTRYIKLLVRNGKLETAVEVGKEVTKMMMASDELTATFKDAFIKLNGSEEAYNVLLAELRKEKLAEIKKHVAESRISKPSVDFTLKYMDGSPVMLSALKGKVVVIDFWATWCGPCKVSFPYLQKVYDKYKDAPDVAFLAIDTWERVKGYEATLENAKKFISDNKYTFPVVIDEKIDGGEMVVEKYGVDGIPTQFIIGKDGMIGFKNLGFEGPVMEDTLTEQIEFLLTGGTEAVKK